ncbi:Teneurin-2, partial [Manis pentadactyla]
RDNTACGLSLLISDSRMDGLDYMRDRAQSPGSKLVLKVPDTGPQTCAPRFAPAHVPALLHHHGFVTVLELSSLRRLPLGTNKRPIGTARPEPFFMTCMRCVDR